MTEPLDSSAGGRAGGSRARRRRAFLPTALVGTLSLALALGTAFTGSDQARAQAEGFDNGIAKAHAQVAAVVPGVGNIDFGIKSGTSTTEVVNDLAQAQSRTLNLGLIGSALVGEKCDGSEGLEESQIPQPLRVDNRQGDASKSQNEVPEEQGPLAGGHRQVEATDVPSATASVSEVSAVFGPLATISGGRALAVSRVVDDEAREAIATTSLDLSIAGVIELQGLHWQASHRTGAKPAVDGAFSVQRASAGGVPLPVEELAPLQDLLNTALAPSGVSIEMPRVEKLKEPNNLVRVTPLTITLRDSPLGKTLVGPGLNLTREQREQLFDTLVGVYCRAAEFLLVGDITVSVASGTGFLVLEVGGVQATSDDFVFENPFGELKPFTPPVPAAPVASPPAAGAAGAPTARGAAPAPPAAPTATQPIASANDGPFEKLCESLHPSEGGCTSGMALPIGLVGAALTAGVGYLDWWRQRRYAAELVAETTA